MRACCCGARGTLWIPCHEKYCRASSVPKDDSPSTMSSRIGPKTLTQDLSMTPMSDGANLSETKSPTCHLMHLHTRWHTINRSMNTRSHSTWSLKRMLTSRLATGDGVGFRQRRQILQVSTVSAINFKTSAGQPAALRVRSIAAAEACHHLRWSLRKIKCRALGPQVPRVLMIRPISKLRQSSSCSPPAA